MCPQAVGGEGDVSLKLVHIKFQIFHGFQQSRNITLWWHIHRTPPFQKIVRDLGYSFQWIKTVFNGFWEVSGQPNLKLGHIMRISNSIVFVAKIPVLWGYKSNWRFLIIRGTSAIIVVAFSTCQFDISAFAFGKNDIHPAFWKKNVRIDVTELACIACVFARSL